MRTLRLVLVGSALSIIACGSDSKSRRAIGEGDAAAGGSGGDSSEGGAKGTGGAKSGGAGGANGGSASGGSANGGGSNASGGVSASDSGAGGGSDGSAGSPADAGGDVVTVPCATTADTVAGLTGAKQVTRAGARLVSSIGGAIVASNLDGTDQTPLITPVTDEFFDRFTIADGVVFASATQNGTDTPRRLARAPVDGSASATFFDLETYTTYKDVVSPGNVYAFVPRADALVSDGTTLFVQDVVYGAVIAFRTTDLTPLGFLTGPPTDQAVYGASHLALDGTRLVAMINRAGIGIDTTVYSVRTFDVSDPAAMAQIAETPRTTKQTNGFVYDPTYSRYLYSANNGLSSSQIFSFTIDAAGKPSAEKLVFDVADHQIRDLAVAGGVVVAASPRFEDPVGANLLLLRNGAAALGLCCTVPLTTQAYGNSITTTADTALVGGGSDSTELQTVPLAACQ